ncbi:MAG TPA: lysine--tRNA ligase [bacterium]|nr:lysine--tRNA ligase [bacterium]
MPARPRFTAAARDGGTGMETGDLYRQRVEKLRLLVEKGAGVYREGFPGRLPVGEALGGFSEGREVRLAGRIVSIRGHGKAIFADLRDASGRIQIYLKKDALPGDVFALAGLLDLGDIVGVSGALFTTRTGEKTLAVRGLSVLSKALREPPLGKAKDGKQWHALADVETRYRQRYLDLMANDESLRVFLARSRIVRGIRAFLDRRGFLEVETPMMQPLPGGAVARPFVTRHRALGAELYLRVAPELYLKRLLVGGFERIYELNRNFRNEGISTRHNPEFTMLELYQAYADYREIMALVEEMVAALADDLLGSRILRYRGSEIRLDPPWPRLPLLEAVRERTGEDLSPEKGEDAAVAAAQRMRLVIEGPKTYAKIVDEAVKTFVVPTLSAPTFLIDHPVALSPLARRKADAPLLVERFQPYIGGLELGNAFSELNDPLDQRERFEAQIAARGRGDEEAHRMDEDFIRALEYGMPPAGGLGIGVDRLVMLFTGCESIRDVILFPQLKPEEGRREATSDEGRDGDLSSDVPRPAARPPAREENPGRGGAEAGGAM